MCVELIARNAGRVEMNLLLTKRDDSNTLYRAAITDCLSYSKVVGHDKLVKGELSNLNQLKR